MDWVEPFYSVTGTWWGDAEAEIGPDDRMRAGYVQTVSPVGGSVLELGCGYGSTAVATAELGRSVTGVDLSTRLDFAPSTAEGSGQVRFIRDDFYEVQLDRVFAAVCYWDGFGVGTDEDQRRLLGRVASEWLDESGVAIIDVFNPVAWENSAGLVEGMGPDPQRGYQYRLGHRRDYDAKGRRALDTWWVDGSDEEWTQSLRCYSPPELEALVAGTGLMVDTLTSLDDPVGVRELDLSIDCWSYVASLRREAES